MLKLRSKPKAPSPSSDVPQGRAFGIRTRIARAVGKHDRYSCDAVRALPSVNREEVVLQVTDGKQAACLLAPGQRAESRLVPADVLPTRQLLKPAVVRLVDGHWQSSEGRIAEDTYGTGEGAFPPIGDVLPAVGKRPLYETQAQAQRRQSKGNCESLCVALGIDVDVLRKTAEALGNSKLTLFVPLPVKGPNTPPSQACVTKPIAVCPANGDGGERGIAVVIPLTPGNGNAYYNKVREVVIASEKLAAQPRAKPRRRAG